MGKVDVIAFLTVLCVERVQWGANVLNCVHLNGLVGPFLALGLLSKVEDRYICLTCDYPSYDLVVTRSIRTGSGV